MTSAAVDRAALVAALASARTPGELASALLRPEERRILRRCALVRRFDEVLFSEVLLPDAATEGSRPSFERVTSLPGVAPAAGRPGWFTLGAEDRSEHERAWLHAADPSATDGDALDVHGFRTLHDRLAAWFEARGPDAEMEVLYHRLSVNAAAEKSRFRARYDAALAAFDLARCESLLEILDQRASFLDPELASLRTDARGLLRAYSAAADDFYRTGRYLERRPLVAAFETVLADPSKWILLLHGGGGRGKTMFLRWLNAHYCLPRRIPVARVDFDFLDQSETGLEPRFFFGKFAERLNRQLPGAPLLELLDLVRQMRRDATARRARSTPRGAAGSQDATDETEVAQRLARVLEEWCRGPVVLVLDTLEDAALKHGIDLLAVVRAVEELRASVGELAAQHGRRAPHIVLVLSGRYTLEQQYPVVHAEVVSHVHTHGVTPFDPKEARAYLLDVRGLADIHVREDVLDTVVERAGGIPFHLALWADVLQARPSITESDIRQHAGVELQYLIERVLRRIPDYPLRWTLRYAVLARRLTKEFVVQVLGPHLARAMRDGRSDDPAIDDVADERWPAIWYERDRSSRQASLDHDELWKRLSSYASESSWVKIDPEVPGALVIQPVVTHPLRRVLRAKPVFGRINRDAARVLRLRLREGSDSPDISLASLTYHEFQLDPTRAATRWRRRLHEFDFDASALEALSAVVLSEDLRESEAADENALGEPLVTPAVEATALFTMARAKLRLAEKLTGESAQGLVAEARSYLRRFDDATARAPHDARVVSLAEEALLRWELAGDEVEQERVLPQLEAAARDRVPAARRQVILQQLVVAYGERDLVRAEEYARQLVALARRRADPASYGHAVRLSLELDRSRGGYGAALARCAAVRAILHEMTARSGGPGIVRSELRLLDEVSVSLEAECGTPSAVLARGDRARPRSEQWSAWEFSTGLLRRANICLDADDPLAAVEAAHHGRVAMSEQPQQARELHSPSFRNAWLTQELELELAEARGRARLMDFASALDQMQDALARASRLEDAPAGAEIEARARLAKARLHLHHVGDLRQAAEHLGTNEEAYADTPWHRFDFLLLLASLNDRRGEGADAQRLLTVAATEVLPRIIRFAPQYRVEVALEALELTSVEQRLPYLGMLHTGLAAIDHPGARLALLRGLRHCRPVDDVPKALASDLLRLTAVPAGGARRRRRARMADDLLRSGLHAVELKRVLGLADEAASDLRALRPALAETRLHLLRRDGSLACDRLGLPAEEVLPRGWLDAFRGAFRGYPMLCGAAFLDEGERQFRHGRTSEARRCARQSEQWLTGPNILRSTHHARLAILQAALAREAHDLGKQGEEQARARLVLDELGRPVHQASGSTSSLGQERTLDRERAESWAEELSEREVLGVRVVSPKEVTLVSWGGSRAVMVETPHPVGAELERLLVGLMRGAVAGPASQPLVDMLRHDWSALGQLLARAMLPDSLGVAVAERLRRVRQPDAPALDIVLECAQPALHGIPWELAAFASGRPRPVVLEPNLRFMWRTLPGVLPRARITWAQHAISRLGIQRLVVDGMMGPATRRAIAKAQQEFSVPPTGLLDEPTLAALRHHLLAVVRTRDVSPGSVLLVQAEAHVAHRSLRGFESRGTDLYEIYRRHGFTVRVFGQSNLSRLREILLLEPTTILHIAAPIAEWRHTGEMFLQLDAGAESVSGTSALGSQSLASMLKSTFGSARAPTVILDVPRPPSSDEALRQLILRNVFASHLYALGGVPVVLATGLAMPDAQQELSVQLVAGLAEGHAPGVLARALRAGPHHHRAGNQLDVLLGTACVALFAHDPHLGTAELSAAKWH